MNVFVLSLVILVVFFVVVLLFGLIVHASRCVCCVVEVGVCLNWLCCGVVLVLLICCDDVELMSCVLFCMLLLLSFGFDVCLFWWYISVIRDCFICGMNLMFVVLHLFLFVRVVFDVHLNWLCCVFN